jgi:hypothetical protein
MTDVDPLEARARSAAARLLADVPASPPPLTEVQRRSKERSVRRAAVTTGLLTVVGLGVAVPVYLNQTSRNDLEGSPAAEALDGRWKLPAPSETVEVKVPVSPSATARATAPPRRPPAVQARTAAGPWRARISGRRLFLRNPSTNATIVQRITFFAPGQFSVQEPPSTGLTAGFGCPDDGVYSWTLDDGGLDVAATDDPCADRVAVLEAGTWITGPVVDPVPPAGPETVESTTPDDSGSSEPTSSQPPSEEAPSSPSPT